MTKEDGTAALAGSLMVLGAFAAVICGIILEGVVISVLWRWFIVPFGVREIGIAWAIGLATIVSVVTPSPRGKPTNAEMAFNAIGKPLLMLLIGWIATHWM